MLGFAQRRGGGGQRPQGGQQGGQPPAKDGGDPAAMADFAKALAVQASDDQADQFRALMIDVEAAKKSAEGLKQQASEKAAVQAGVEKARNETRDFLKDFSKPQKTGLKPQLQQLSKSEAELDHASKGLAASAEAADRIQKAIADFQSKLAALGDEMGIQLQSQAGSQGSPKK